MISGDTLDDFGYLSDTYVEKQNEKPKEKKEKKITEKIEVFKKVKVF
jgi:hypothetical protein